MEGNFRRIASHVFEIVLNIAHVRLSEHYDNFMLILLLENQEFQI